MPEIVPDDEIEVGAEGMYGNGWNSNDPQKRPGDRMKDVWRKYAKDCLEAAAKLRSSKEGLK
jgi:hypothetical protein